MLACACECSYFQDLVGVATGLAGQRSHESRDEKEAERHHDGEGPATATARPPGAVQRRLYASSGMTRDDWAGW